MYYFSEERGSRCIAAVLGLFWFVNGYFPCFMYINCWEQLDSQLDAWTKKSKQMTEHILLNFFAKIWISKCFIMCIIMLSK